jgi:putative membrane protein
MNRVAWALVAAAVAALGAPQAGAAGASVTVAQADAPLSDADHTFVTEAVRSGWARLRLGEVAATRAEDERVREFAERVVEEEAAANESLREIGQQRGLLPPTEPSAEDQYVIDHLGDLAAPEFDVEYMTQQVDAHETAVVLYQMQLDQTADPELRDFAGTYLPTLEERAEAAREIAQQLKAGAS